MSTPRSMRSRASVENFTSLAAIENYSDWNVLFDLVMAGLVPAISMMRVRAFLSGIAGHQAVYARL
jgi:hypothetical protein